VTLSAAPVASVFASPLDRAVETGEILAAPHGLAVQTDERLIEWSFWERWAGMPWASIHERDPDVLEAYGLDPAAASPGDPLEAAGRRVLSWAEDVEERGDPTEGKAGRSSAEPSSSLVLGITHEAPLIAAMLVGRGQGISSYHGTNLPHLGAVRLRPGPPEIVDLAAWAARC
jgi:broad specificity phosphatase PhoE